MTSTPGVSAKSSSWRNRARSGSRSRAITRRAAGARKPGEGPQTRADLHHGVLAGQVQGRDNAPGLVRVEQEVLAQGLLRPQAQTLQEGFGESRRTRRALCHFAPVIALDDPQGQEIGHDGRGNGEDDAPHLQGHAPLPEHADPGFKTEGLRKHQGLAAIEQELPHLVGGQVDGRNSQGIAQSGCPERR